MAALNRVQLLGSLTNDPELRYTPSGKGVLNFNLQVEAESINIFPIYVWGKLAELCNEQLRKGSRIYLEGRLVIDNKTVIKTTSIFEGEEYDDEDDRYSVQVVAKRIEFLDNQSENQFVSENKDKIDDVIRVLEVLALDPYVDHNMIFNLIKHLNSLDLENMD